jgi:hypothetical protein
VAFICVRGRCIYIRTCGEGTRRTWLSGRLRNPIMWTSTKTHLSTVTIVGCSMDHRRAHLCITTTCLRRPPSLGPLSGRYRQVLYCIRVHIMMLPPINSLKQPITLFCMVPLYIKNSFVSMKIYNKIDNKGGMYLWWCQISTQGGQNQYSSIYMQHPFFCCHSITLCRVHVSVHRHTGAIAVFPLFIVILLGISGWICIVPK